LEILLILFTIFVWANRNNSPNADSNWDYNVPIRDTKSKENKVYDPAFPDFKFQFGKWMTSIR
jgi:hypothetical protein